MSFLFVWKMTGRSRDYRMKVLPAMGYIVVMMVVPILNHGKNLSIENMRNGVKAAVLFIIAPIYMSSLFLFMAMSQLAYSEKFKASWIYHVAPVEMPGQLIIGAIKSVLTKFFLPFVLLLSMAGLLFWGIKILPNLLLAIVNQLFICGIYGLFVVKNIPFSEEQPIATQNSKVIRTLMVFFISAIPIGLHFLIYNYLWMIGPLGLLSLTGTYFIMKDIRKTTWQELYPGR